MGRRGKEGEGGGDINILMIRGALAHLKSGILYFIVVVVPLQWAYHLESQLKADSMEPTPRNSDFSGLDEAQEYAFLTGSLGDSNAADPKTAV